MSRPPVRVSGDWLALREPADAAARARDLAEQLTRRFTPSDGWLVHDLGGGTGSMGRWLAPLLPGPQRWVVHDRDADLLLAAAASPPGPAADGAMVTVEPRRSDILELTGADLAGATLITASALLDMLTQHELAQLLSVCAGTGCPILLALSVVGQVRLRPDDPLDARIGSAFNAHQRRETERGRLLGPDAPVRAAEAFARRGAEVLTRESPWQLGGGEPDLTRQWLRGWVAAACEQEPALAADAVGYSHRRLAQLAAGRLAVTVSHVDLLVLPAPAQAPSNRDESA